jgi:hypothetical protein
MCLAVTPWAQLQPLGSQHFGGSQQEGTGVHTLTGTCLQTTRGTHRVTVYGTRFGTSFTHWIVLV